MPENRRVAYAGAQVFGDSGFPGKLRKRLKRAFTGIITGGEKRACTDHIGMYRVQTAQLQHDKRKEKPSGQDGNQQILQILQKAHAAQRDQIIGARCYYGR